MISYEFKNSFDKSIKSLPHKEKQAAKDLAKSLIDVLERKKQASKGLGLECLRGDYWEARKSHKQRMLFRWRGNHVEFILVGSHDQIRKFLREF